MNIFDKIYRQAKSNPQKIVLPEGAEPRVITAAVEATKEELAQIILLGEPDVVLKKAKENSLDISKIEIINPREDEKLDDYIKAYWSLRKDKGVTEQSAKDLLLQDYVYYGAMMLRQRRVDGFIAGAFHTTSHVARAILRCIEKDPKYATSSGSFLVEIKDGTYGEDGLFLFSDCAIIPLPEAQQLADIALSSSEVWTKITGYKPRVAMLSFSSKGSSSHALLDKVRRATEMVKKAKPDLVVDGELQADSAIEPCVAKRKAPNSPLEGRANILIFPNLEAGNIAYKLMQRLAKARVVGPIIQGLSRACSDLSRGCNPREIVDAIAVTSVRAQ
ncbi:MAG: phosphate acetyltransferase [Candidatus Omnitrophica bacterium]|nr:phosphate acetyltransferase [Candidatus Omnitrophota bacterium]